MKCPKCQSDNPDSTRFCGQCGGSLSPGEDIQYSGTKTITGAAIGSLFAQRYRIIEKLGQGGMGVVYKAEDLRLKRTVALKFLPVELTKDTEAKERFMREAQSAAALSHPNICTIHEVDEEKGTPFISMEYVEDQTLKKRMAKRPLAFDEMLHIAVQIGKGLDAAHKKGIIHRDIKSSNIMVKENGQTKIMDFGLAKVKGAAHITKETTTLGTVAYMSPEQARGQAVDHRSDIWSLGVVFYEMLSAQLPFRGNDDQLVLNAIVNEEVLSLSKIRSSIPPELEMIVNKCLKKDPKSRYQAVSELNGDLERLVLDISKGYFYSSRVKRKVFQARPLSSWFYRSIIIIVLMVILAMAIPNIREFVVVKLGLRSIPDIQYLAILPFTLSENDPQLAQVNNGLVQTLTNKLTQLESFQKTLQVVPSNDVIRMGINSAKSARKDLGVKLVISGQMVPVLEKIKLMLSLDNTDPPRQLRSRDIEVNQEDLHTLYEKAIYAVVEMLALEIKPGMNRIIETKGTNDPDAWIYTMEALGILDNSQGEEDVDRAIQLLNKAIEKDPEYISAFIGLSDACWEKYEISKNSVWEAQAKSNCLNALRIDENSIDGHFALSNILSETGDYENAIDHLQKVLELDPFHSQAHRNLAFVYERSGRLEEAEVEYKKAIEIKPDYWRGYHFLGVFYYYQGHYEEAVDTFLRIAALTPDRTAPFNLLGAVYVRMGKIDLAIQNLERSIEIEPNYTAYSNLGTIYFFNEKNYEKARDMYEKASRLNPTVFAVLGNLADSYRYLGQKQKAREFYEKAAKLAEKELEVKTKEAKTFAMLGRYYALLDKWEEAWEKASQAKKLAPKNIDVLLVCVKVFELIGKRDQALECLEVIVGLGGKWGDIEDSPDFIELRNDPRYLKLINR